MIHKYKLNGYNIVLDVNSGGVHVVDDLTYDLLDNVSPPFKSDCPDSVLEKLSRFYSAEDIKSCYEEVVSLYNDKILFSEDDYEKFANKCVASPIKAMCLLIAMDCNLRCEYCFASTGDYGHGRKLMDFETGKRAIDFLISNSLDRENLEVDFFGGEPLMNFEIVKQIVDYGRSLEEKHNKKFSFTITTNGMLLNDENIDYINKEMYNVVLSIDGRKEVNDRMRKRINGSGSYDQIVSNYKKLVSKRGDKEYYVRGTYTGYNLDFSNDVMHLLDEGFDQISVEPVITSSSEPYYISEKDLPNIFSEYEKLANGMIQLERENRFCNFFHFMLDLDQGPCAIKRLRGCGSGNDYVAITPDGDIYPCHQFVGMDEFKMGNIADGKLDMGIKEYFVNTHIYSKPDCQKCWAKFYCSGGCNANNYTYGGDVHNVHKISCEIHKKRLECAVMLKVNEVASEE